MQDLLAFLLVVIVAVGGAELVRATCLKQLATPAPVRVTQQQTVGALAD